MKRMLHVIAEIGLNHNGSEERAWDLLKSVLDTEIDGFTL
jgi:sialic acid synthase SpsE